MSAYDSNHRQLYILIGIYFSIGYVGVKQNFVIIGVKGVVRGGGGINNKFPGKVLGGLQN